jgi:hypothetical protein
MPPGAELIVQPFPAPTRLVDRAYAKLRVLATGTDEEIRALGPLERLERPWEPNRCGVATRRQLWDWLDDVAAWVNAEYGWGVERLIPPCWPQHPHIAHELAVLADQRYSAGLALHSGALEEWHRYSLPMFLDRLTARVGNRCVTRHDEWPAAPRYRAFTSPPVTSERADRFDTDARAVTAAMAAVGAGPGPGMGGANGHPGASGAASHLVVVDGRTFDTDTGASLDDRPQP